jgi:hypothetical protein
VISIGYRLEECSYFEKSVASIMDCAHLCLRENGQCRSINIEKARSEGGFICHFNNSTRKNHIQKFAKNAAYSYLEPEMVCIYVLDFIAVLYTFTRKYMHAETPRIADKIFPNIKYLN